MSAHCRRCECEIPEVNGDLCSDCRVIDPDWTRECQVCGARPIVPMTGLCGPCTFGEADTVGGNW